MTVTTVMTVMMMTTVAVMVVVVKRWNGTSGPDDVGVAAWDSISDQSIDRVGGMRERKKGTLILCLFLPAAHVVTLLAQFSPE